MKKLFTIKTDGKWFNIEEENKVFGLFDKKRNKWDFYDYDGKSCDYERPYIDDVDTDDCFEEDESEETPVYNKYGVAEGESSLIDLDGNIIPDTQFNCVDESGEECRYFVFTTLTEEQLAEIGRCGTAPGITMNIYDTKNREYVVKGIPECILYPFDFDGDKEVVMAAAELVNQYDYITIEGIGTIVAHNGEEITVYDYYQ